MYHCDENVSVQYGFDSQFEKDFAKFKLYKSALILAL